jgi:hypothetical protein
MGLSLKGKATLRVILPCGVLLPRGKIDPYGCSVHEGNLSLRVVVKSNWKINFSGVFIRIKF